MGPNTSLVPSNQVVRPAGVSLSFGGRPVDMAMAPNGRILYAKDDRGIVVVDVAAWKVTQELSMKGGTSLHGIAVTPDGKRLLATDAASGLHLGDIGSDGKVTWTRTIAFGKPDAGVDAYPLGALLIERGSKALIALSRSNAVAVVDLNSGGVERTIPVDVAPYGLAQTADGKFLVGCWATRPKAGGKRAPASGTPVEVDERGIGIGGTVCEVDLAQQKVTRHWPVGLQPTDIQIQGKTAYVANANSDSVSVIDLAGGKVQAIDVKPDHKLPFGSAPNALVLAGKRLYVACGGNNAVAQVRLGAKPAVDGYIPTGWYPTALLVHGSELFVANAKGVGSRHKPKDAKGYGVYQFEGTLTKISLPDSKQLNDYTAQVRKDLNVPRILQAREATLLSKAKPAPVPIRLGDPSVFKHVVYILKENRTYDQVLGDIGKGDSDPNLCIYGEQVTPNAHALANEFVLLDNYYCNGVNSADGHAWSMEGNATAYFEKTFGGWTRSYPYGDDPLSVSSSGYLWDSVLERGLSFRNYGEFDYAEPVKKGLSFGDIYKDFTSGQRQVSFSQNIGVERLRSYSCREFPGWNLNIPDVLRADVFIRELAQMSDLPNLTIVYLPQDHTSGTAPGGPTPRAQVADNDLAMGRVIEALSKSKYWPETVVFAIEDDPQDGFDHVDGHRSLCMVASPYTKRGEVVSDFYNQTAMLHTMLRILGVAPMNQMVARSSLMSACFTSKPNFEPYVCKPNRVPLDEVNPPLKTLSGLDREMALASVRLPLDKPDQGSDELKNRILWRAAKGASKPYPAALAGAHGRGLKERGLKLVANGMTGRRDED